MKLEMPSEEAILCLLMNQPLSTYSEDDINQLKTIAFNMRRAGQESLILQRAERGIYAEKFPQSPVSWAGIVHTSNPCFEKLTKDQSEALKDRTVKVDVPFMLKMCDLSKGLVGEPAAFNYADDDPFTEDEAILANQYAKQAELDDMTEDKPEALKDRTVKVDITEFFAGQELDDETDDPKLGVFGKAIDKQDKQNTMNMVKKDKNYLHQLKKYLLHQDCDYSFLKSAERLYKPDSQDAEQFRNEVAAVLWAESQ